MNIKELLAKKSTKIGLLLLAVLILLIAVSCGDSTSKIDENIRNVEIQRQRYKEKDDISVGIPVLVGMKDEDLQKKINENLKKAILSNMINKGDKPGLEGDFSIVSINERLLIIMFDGWSFAKDANNNSLVKKAIHIDLTTGKIYEPTEIFKKNSKYEQEIINLTRNAPDLRMFEPGGDDKWKHELFKNNWNTKKQNQLLVLGDDFLWVYAFNEKGIIPGYGIPYEELDDLIDEDSDLWQAFVYAGSWGEEYESYVPLAEYEEDVKARLADEATAKKAAEQKAAAKKAAEQKAAAQKAAAQKAANQKAAAQKASTQKAVAKKAVPKAIAYWKVTSVVKNASGPSITINGQYVNNTNKTINKINASQLTIYYKATDGKQKSWAVKYAPVNKVVKAGGGVATSWFVAHYPKDYKSFVKAVNKFSYSY